LASWWKRVLGQRTDRQSSKSVVSEAPNNPSNWHNLPPGVDKTNWREHLIRMTSPIEVGGFRPTQSPLASVFGDVRVALQDENSPVFDGTPLWPLCQFNLGDAPLVPAELSDLKFISIFVHPDIIPESREIIDTAETDFSGPMVIRTYESVHDLVDIRRPDTTTPLKPFEIRWLDPVPDYPNHDCLAFDFNMLGLGGYYDQPDAVNVQATKLGGYPGTVQSEPWWDYKENDENFRFVIQLDCEPKSNWGWGDGAAFLARSQKNPKLWALDIQFT